MNEPYSERKHKKKHDQNESFSFLYGQDILTSLGIYFVPDSDIILKPGA